MKDSTTKQMTVPNPSGLCLCGCGEKAPLAHQTDSKRGYVKDQPHRFIVGHGKRKPHQLALNPNGLCLCGCGQPAPIAIKSCYRRGYIKGQSMRYIRQHQILKSPLAYIEQDCGYTSPCWVWQRATNSQGYGSLWVDGKCRGTHIVYWERRHGQVPAGLELDHLCRNRPCINPTHLEPVTRSVNIIRGLGRQAKLTADQVIEIRKRYLAGSSQRTLAKEFGVCRTNISFIVCNKTWTHIAMPSHDD